MRTDCKNLRLSIALLTSLGLTLFASLGVAQSTAETTAPPLARKISFHIESQDLQTALNQFALQSRKDLLFSPDITAAKRSTTLKGAYSPEQALQRLLAGTGLTYRAADERTILVEVAYSGAGARSDAGVPADSLRLAQTPPAPAANRRADGADRVAADEKQGTATPSDAKGIPEMLVKGNRSLNTDIERSEDAPQPYVVFSKEEIQRSQALHLGDFLKNRLPMNTEAAGVTTGIQYTTTGNSGTYSNINLRGLGSNQTLLLIDGRRLPARAVSGTTNQPDINGIPLAAIERIEVLPSTAGGIYGGSATGGVINIVMRRDYQGVEARASYANTFDTDASNMRLEANGGFSLEGGRTQILISATHLESNDLKVGDRDFVERGLALQLKNNPAAVTGSSTPPLGATVNILSAQITDGTRENLVLKPEYGGAALGFTTTHLPLGYAGAASDNGAGLVANAGSYNLELANDLSGRRRGLFGTPNTESVALNVRREFTSWLEAFVDAAHLSNTGTSAVTGITTSVTLPSTAPNNPFEQNIAVRFPEPSLSFDQVNESTVQRATAGVIARLPYNWTAEIDYGWSRSKYRALINSPLDSAGTLSLRTGLPGTDGRPALNALQEGNTFPIDFTPYLLPSPTGRNGNETTLKDATLRASGPALALPGGALNLSMLLERREETLEDAIYESINSTSRLMTYSWYPSRSQEIDSFYLEARAPLISARNARPFLRDLELQASVRHDRYTTHQQREGTSFSVDSPDGPFMPLTYATNELRSSDYTVGFRYSPVEDLALRASFGTGFLPPSVSQIVSSSIPNVTFNLGTDPERGDTPMSVPGVPWTYIYSGNSNIGPEESESFSVGLIFTPRFARDLRLSIDYTRIDKVDEIQIPDWQFLLDNQELFPERFERGPTRDIDPDTWLGPITSFDTSLINIASTTVEAYDIQADYILRTDRFGEFRSYAVVTWQPHYLNQAIPASPVNDSVGFSGGTLEWRGNLGVTWDRGPLEVSWNAQYFDSYYAFSSTASQGSIDSAVLNQGSDTIPSQLYHDVLATYRFDSATSWARGLFADTEISVGIQNLFDKSPPILALTNTTGAGFSTYGDPRLRRYSISIRKSFY